MKTCGTCKFWSVLFNTENGVSDCDKPNNIHNDSNTSMALKATASDDSGLNVSLMTGKYFGCIHHSQK